MLWEHLSGVRSSPPRPIIIMENNQLLEWIFKTVVITLAFICLSVVIVLLYAFFDAKVDNEKIFEIISPAFNMVVGAFVGLLGGISLRSK